MIMFSDVYSVSKFMNTIDEFSRLMTVLYFYHFYRTITVLFLVYNAYVILLYN